MPALYRGPKHLYSGTLIAIPPYEHQPSSELEQQFEPCTIEFTQSRFSGISVADACAEEFSALIPKASEPLTAAHEAFLTAASKFVIQWPFHEELKVECPRSSPINPITYGSIVHYIGKMVSIYVVNCAIMGSFRFEIAEKSTKPAKTEEEWLNAVKKIDEKDLYIFGVARVSATHWAVNLGMLVPSKDPDMCRPIEESAALLADYLASRGKYEELPDPEHLVQGEILFRQNGTFSATDKT